MLPEAAAYKKNWQKAQRARLKDGCVNDSYMYVHLAEDSGETFYVGIGHTVGRPWDKTCRTIEHRKNIREHGYQVEIIIDNVTEDTALYWERTWIKSLRLQGFNLENKASGGQRGWRHTEDSRRKMSENNSMRNNEFRKNQKLGAIAAWESPERKENLSRNNPMKDPEIAEKNASLRRGKELPSMKGGLHPRAQKIIEIDDNKLFNSIKEAADYYGLKSVDICAVCKGRQKTTGKRIFKYVEEA
jgi:hypothetical protein